MKMGRVGFCSLALLAQWGGADAFRARHKSKGKKAVAVTQEMQETQVKSCAANNLLASVVRRTVNGALNLALRGNDPLNESFHAGKWEVDLWRCNIGLELDARVMLAGFEGAHIDTLECVSEVCVEEGRFGCAIKDYTFSAGILFGENIAAGGECSANWNLCGLERPDREVSIGVESVDPGIGAQFVIRKQGFQYKIASVKGLDTNWGTLQNFQCGFSSLPNFIGSRLEKWCSSIIEWVAQKAQLHLSDRVDQLLLDLINRILDMPADEEDAEGAAIAEAASTTGKIIDLPDHQFKVHSPAGTQASCEAILFSVGTSVSVGGYDSMAAALVKRGFVVAIVDPEKGWPTKLNEDKLRFAYSHAKENLLTWSEGACGSISKWIVGGHSAGGGTAHKVLAADPSMADGVFSVDPFTKGGLGGMVNLPGLYWGFDVTTCFVTKEQAASAYYSLTDTDKRIFVRAQKEYVNSKCGYSPKYYHCSVVDGGCTACTNCMDTPEYFFEDVADSVQKFSEGFAKRSWSVDVLGLKSTTPVDYFVGADL